ncbi:A-kinase anchor protein 9 isoform X2 [Periophthalmus magnuspinnatus]|uniref:A-kinase anchor protein 9 isoform X2 n=1 Tax=Periophthalmus magnuspinnatus TaxID=409849 RepID=UPI0024369439|nr:A-kinase anchor protein 9 isoform X2 [Periophthalmus magnuspinnatus]
MEDEERQKKLEAGKAKLAEYRQRKAHADSQKKQKKKKKKTAEGDSEGDSLGRTESKLNRTLGGDEPTVPGVDGGDRTHPPTTEFSLTKTLRSGETVKHDQTYTIEPESEVSTTAEDYSSEVNGCHEMTLNVSLSSKEFIWEEVDAMDQMTSGGSLQEVEDILAEKSREVEKLNRELEEMRSAFGADGVQQLQDFEAALKQRDGIITQLTANLQQAREEKDEIMKEFLELTEQSQKLQIQFQQLQAGESLRNSSHSNTAADLLQARQQLLQLQQQLQEQAQERDKEQDKERERAREREREEAQSREDTETISRLQQRINDMGMEKIRAEECLNEKDLLIAEQEKTILNQEQSLKELRMSEESFAQTLKEKTQLLLEQSAIISEHEQSLSLLREELSRAAGENNMQQTDEKDQIIAEKERVIIERDYTITELEDELESSQKRLHSLSQQMATKGVELERCLETLESTKSDLESCKNELNNCKLDLEKEHCELERFKNELSLSKQKERMSSDEIMQLMGTVEDLQKRCHKGSLSENETIQKMQEDAERKLEVLRAELDEMYGQQIVQMKVELNLQNAERIEQINQQHQVEIELLKTQYLSETLSASTSEKEALNGQIKQLQDTIEQSRVIHNKTVQELNKVTKENLNLQEKVDGLLQDLKFAKEQVELVSHNAVSQESHKLQLLQETIDNLKRQLETAQETAQEMQEKYESETTNYKIKLEMLEREKDEVLDRMAESQEAELERLRTQLLFSHEEELTNLREDLQRESFLNTENLLNEAAITHEKALDDLRISYDEKVNLLQQENENVATERDELLHQILELKEDLNVALHSSKADELVQQLQELQTEIEELRKGGEKRISLDNEIRGLQEKIEALEKQAKENKQMWDNALKERQTEIEILNMSNKALKEEMDLKLKDIENITAEKNRYQQQVVTLKDEMEKQSTTFSFAEKNFEVNYQELKDEYTCLVEAKTKLEEQKILETLELEAKISSLEAQIQKMEDRVSEIKMDEGKIVVEKDTTELMEKLNFTLIEKESLTGRLHEVMEQLATAEGKVGCLEEELIKVKQENAKVIAQNENLGKEIKKTHENTATIFNADSQQLRGEIQTLQSLLRETEEERDKIRQTLELQRVSQTPSLGALGEEGLVVKGPSSTRKSAAASGSNRRKRRQRNKQNQGGVVRSSREEREDEEEEGGTPAEGATSAAEPREQSAVVMSCTHEPIAKEDESDESQGDAAKHGSKQVTRHGMRHRTQPQMRHGAEEVVQSADHGECRLRLEAQHLSLSQIHAAQLELLQEEAQTKAVEISLQKDQRDQAAPRLSKYQNMVKAVSEECREIILSFQKMFGEDFSDKAIVEETHPVSSNERPETSESLSVIHDARELYRDLQQVRDSIEQEHHRLSKLQTLLRADGSKMMELQSAYDNLKSSTDKEISNLRLQVSSVSSNLSKDLSEQAHSAAAVTSTSQTSSEIQMLKVEAQQKQKQLEHSHRQEVERLRAHYQQQAAETEERYATELFMLQQRLQEVNAAPSHFSSSTEASGFDKHEQLKEVEEEFSEGGWTTTAQLQSLKKALQQKYVQEVETLKEQHRAELRRLTKEEGRGARGEEQSISGLEPQHWERVEEEVAKAIVQMSVEFAQKTELARLSKDLGQASSSMQTEEDEEEEETPRASVTGDWAESERDQLQLEIQQRDAEIEKLRDQLQKAERALNQVSALKQGEDEGEVLVEEAVVSSAAKTTHAPRSQEDEQEDERALLLRANEQLSQVLVDVLTTTSAAEKTLGLHLQTLTKASSTERVKHATGNGLGSESGADEETFPFVEVEVEEDLEMLQHMDRLLQGAASQLENQEYLTNISTRLQNALEKMLMAITNATDQLEHAKLTQTELMRESFRHNQEMSELLQRQDELQERLSEEARAREQLALELHRAEGVIDGYTGERAALEEQLRQKEELLLSLEQELEVTSSRLHELEQERLQLQEERELMSRQQEAMREEAGPRELRLVEAAMVAAPEADLLEETEKLMQEKVEVQRQAEKQSSDLLKQVKLLEAELEEQVTRVMDLEQTQSSETADLQQQIQALEKQLDKNRRFLDEQAVDREHERDFFQTEIQKLEDQLKSSQKPQSGSEQRNLEVEQLSAQLKEKADWCSELLLSSEQLQRDLSERDEEIDKLESRIRELEQALLASTESLEVEQKKHHAPITEARHPSLEAQLQTEREALERKEKEICNLEEQLEQFKEELENKSEELQQLQMQLEIQRKEIDSQQQDLDTRDSLLQVVEEKDREIALLNEQISKLQHTDTASDNKEMDERDEVVRDLESQVECLRSEQQRLKRDHAEEMDQLNAVIDKLQQDLANIEQKTGAVEDYEEDKDLPGRPTSEEYDEVKQKMDSATKELDTLKSEHGKLLDTYLRLKESAKALAESEKAENSESSEIELEDVLREKTAALVVMQAQVQALEQSATYKVEELDRRIHELQDLVEERDNELSRCRLLVEQTQNYADGLQEKIYKLEENLRDKVASALVSQATLEAFQQQQSPQPKHQPVVYDFGSFNIPHMDFSGYSQTRGGSTGRVVHLTEKLRELEVGLSGMQKDQELQNQLLSSSEEDVLEYERRLALLMDLLSQMKSGASHRSAPMLQTASPPADQHSEAKRLQEVRDEASLTKEQLESSSHIQDQLIEKTLAIQRLEEQLQMMSSNSDEGARISELQQELKEAQSEASVAKVELSSCKDSLDKLQELLQEREMTIAQLKGELFQASSKSGEESRASELQQQLKEAQSEASVAKEELSSCKESVDKLQELLQEREMTIAQLKAELFQVKADEDRDSFTEVFHNLEEATKTAASTKEELNNMKQQNIELEDELKSSEVAISQLKEQLQEVRNNMENTKEELIGYKEQNTKLQNEASERESLISSLKVELQEAHTALVKQTDISSPPSPSPSPQPPSSSSSISQSKKKGVKQSAPKGSSAKDKPSLSRKNSSSSHSSHKSHSLRSYGSMEQHHAIDAFTQTENLQISNQGTVESCETKDEMEEVIGNFQEKIEQMQELHAAEILDMESRHIAESENLRRDTQALEDECKALKSVIEKLRSSNEASSVKLERSASQFKDGYTSDSSSDFSQRTGYDLPSLQHEYRTTPEGARRDNDETLPDRIKTLLREVHQEGMQVLSLSELPLSEADPSAQFNVQGWAKERDALLSTVESLKGLITSMQTHTESQTSGGVDWRGQLLEAVQKVFQNERSVLKNTLYSQLDLLDTSDAIIHLNQLEQRLAEQDAQQREAIGLLHSSDRSSLLSEIHYLQSQMERLNQGGDSAAVLGAELSLKEQTEAEGERVLVEDLKTELSQTKLELETTLKAQHKHIKELDTLRAEVSQKASEVDALSDQLIEEKKKSRELQWAMEKERCRTGRDEENKREELEDLQLDLEEQRALVSRLTSELEQQRQTSAQSSQQLEQERLSLQRHLQELQVQLDTERAKAQEMSSALGRERELRRGGSADSGGPVTGEGGEEKRGGTEEDENILDRLQKELDDKHAQVVQLLGQVEVQKLEVVRKDEELTLVKQRSTRDHEALLEAQAQLEKLKSQMRQTQEQLDREVQRGKHLEEQRSRLEQRLGRGEDTGDRPGPMQAEGHTTQWESETSDRTKDWVMQQKTSSPSSHLDLTGPGTSSGLHHGPWRTVDSVLGKLHLVSSKVHSLANKAAGRPTSEVDTEELSWVQSNIDEVISMLKQSPGLPPLPESSLLAGGSSSLTERLLRQNAELTGFVSRLTEEKNDLRNQMLRLEEELRRYRHSAMGSTDASSSRRGGSQGDSTSLLLSQERETWTRERARLEKALHQAQSQIARLKTEVRTETLREISGPEADNAALKRMYGRYLRSESFRKALVYQKKYLLLLLGGFQECEEATLTLLSRMGGRPALSGLESFSQRRKGLTRFRSAVRVSIALSRMRFLVKRWHKATGMSSSPSPTVTKNGLGQTLDTDVRDSPYLRPGSVEMYRDRDRDRGGVSSSRGRSGRESPRSAVSSAQHRYHMSGEHGPLTCSHLQNYDPDRALTDYISRLEALQRRLGSVTSGASSSYAQLHFGLRR